jgi:hypothetical protein
MRRGLTILLAAVAAVAVGVPAASATTGWTIQPTPIPAKGQSGQLAAVSCTSATSCTAVGTYIKLGSGYPLAEYWDGSTWTVQAMPRPSGANYVYPTALSCGSASSCTAVGYYRFGTNGEALLAEHWNGSKWSVQTVPSPSGTSIILNAVSCPSADSCTAVGDYGNFTASIGNTFAEYWDGSTWTVQATHALPADETQAYLNGVSCTAPGTCVAVGWFLRHGKDATLAERSRGGVWRILSALGPSAPEGQLNAVSCAAAKSCAAVGVTTTPNGPTGPMAEQWSDSTWTVQAPPGVSTTTLSAVWCSSALRCMAVGHDSDNGKLVAVADQYDNGTWRREATARPASKVLAGIWCGPSSSCTAVGANMVEAGTGFYVTSALAEQKASAG